MDFENRTPFPARLFRSSIADDEMIAAAMARVTFDLTPDGPVPSPDQAWGVTREPVETLHGVKDSDDLYYREGADVLLLGSARAEGGRPALEIEVAVEIGDFRRRVLVLGDRRWERGDDGVLVASAPSPFVELPLVLANAFGGKDTWDELEVPFAENPEGKGFILEEANAEGRPLPNIEDPERRIVRWDDRPEPVGVGFCAFPSALRVRHGLDVDEHGALQRVNATFFNEAFPRMIAPAITPGQRVRVTGMSAAGPIEFVVPELPLVARVAFGERARGDLPLGIDQLGVEPDARRIFLSYRAPFRYTIHPREPRSCVLIRSRGQTTAGSHEP